MKTYKTVKEAVQAFALDAGFNPFAHKNMGARAIEGGKIFYRPTREALTALGYPVTPKRKGGKK